MPNNDTLSSNGNYKAKNFSIYLLFSGMMIGYPPNSNQSKTNK